MTDVADALARATTHSAFLSGLIRREPELVALLQEQGPDAALAASLARMDPGEPAVALRRARAGVALTVAIADLAGQWPLERVTEALTAFADAALERAIAAAFAERGLERIGLVALALGKMGSRELNYSSDVDLIFLHDPDRLPRKAGEDPTDAAVRLVRRIGALLADRTGDGYVARVDLRLRPDPDSTPASLPVGAAELYYQSQALMWERSAFIRARPAAGDLALGRQFLAAIDPFIWRRSLDYSALAEIREVSHQIREHFAEGQKPGPGFDLKRGRGGIREIEFHAQLHQMLFGGRDPALRKPATLDALAALAESGRIDPADAAILADSYRYLRTLEHRLQMVDDQQTHAIPRLAADRARVAGLDGAASWKAIETALLPHLKAVARRYDLLLRQGEENPRGTRLPRDSGAVADWARRNRLEDPLLLVTLTEGWRSGRSRSLRAPEALRAFEAVLPALLGAIGRRREALLRLDRFVQALPSGVQFWRLLAAHPALVTTLGRLLTATPLLADALAKRPALLDILLEPALPLPDIAAARAELAGVTRGLTGEPLLDRVRSWTAERRFFAGVRLLDGSDTPRAVSETLALMAEATVERLADAVADELAERHGTVPDAAPVVLALGRFGGGQLTHQSDLDLVILFTGAFDARSNGPVPLTASVWFNRFGARLVSALSVPTAAGALYEVDTRLRPSGSDGLLVVSLDSFARYQAETAELWETMALTRARPVSGPDRDRARVQAAIDTIIAMPREPATVRREAVAMRQLMATHKPPRGAWDVKLMKGGLVDLEFVVQARALLAGAPVPPGLETAVAALAQSLAGPLALYRDILVMQRLMQPHDASAPPRGMEAATLARACGKSGLGALKAALQEARAEVLASWHETFPSAKDVP